MYDLLLLVWFRSGAVMILFRICCRCPDSKMYDLLPLFLHRSIFSIYGEERQANITDFGMSGASAVMTQLLPGPDSRQFMFN